MVCPKWLATRTRSIMSTFPSPFNVGAWVPARVPDVAPKERPTIARSIMSTFEVPVEIPRAL